MNLSEQLRAVTELLRAGNARHALAGGLVASLYRQNPRMTADVDFLFFSGRQSEADAKKILHALGLEISEVRKAQLEGGPLHAIRNKSSPVLLIAGRPLEPAAKVGVDFLLSGFPWFEKALERAEKNLINFGFGKIPCLTVEDILLSKFYAVSNRADRFQDFDDIKDIFQANPKPDLNYLSSRMREMRIKLPSALKHRVPEILWKTSNSLR